ncbi:EthD family reductase [Pararhizobium haloflavum]|uniref:EthD family reductase n=1 Tax=Pararhizobium haloflavum TaxID=2037914 RepID=UPI000C18D2B6|nr:EthD family reductase [Pararhizobium haloflavum]
MAKLIAMYRTPQDKTAFDRYYRETHVPLAKKIPGLRKYEISRGGIDTPGGPADYHLLAILHFDSLDAIRSALGSPEGKAAAGDIANFADGGADLYFFDEETL